MKHSWVRFISICKAKGWIWIFWEIDSIGSTPHLFSIARVSSNSLNMIWDLKMIPGYLSCCQMPCPVKQHPIDRRHHVGETVEKAKDGTADWLWGLCLSNAVCLDLSLSPSKMGGNNFSGSQKSLWTLENGQACPRSICVYSKGMEEGIILILLSEEMAGWKNRLTPGY